MVAGFVLDSTNSYALIFHICSGMLVFGGLYYLIYASASKQFD